MTGPTIADLQKRCYDQAAAKGFHALLPVLSGNKDLLTHYRLAKLALIHSEVSELAEEIRNGEPIRQNYYPGHRAGVEDDSVLDEDAGATYLPPGMGGEGKPEGIPAEAADILIRLLDWCGSEGIDLQAAVLEKLDYNATRAHMHGKNA